MSLLSVHYHGVHFDEFKSRLLVFCELVAIGVNHPIANHEEGKNGGKNDERRVVDLVRHPLAQGELLLLLCIIGRVLLVLDVVPGNVG